MPEKPPAGWYLDSTGANRWWDGENWTEHRSSPPVGQSASTSPDRSHTSSEVAPKKKRRVFLWFFLVVQILFVIWAVAGVSAGAGTPQDCGTLSDEACNAATDFGTSIGVALIVFVWVVADFFLAVMYGVYRLVKS